MAYLSPPCLSRLPGAPRMAPRVCVLQSGREFFVGRHWAVLDVRSNAGEGASDLRLSFDDGRVVLPLAALPDKRVVRLPDSFSTIHLVGDWAGHAPAVRLRPITTMEAAVRVSWAWLGSFAAQWRLLPRRFRTLTLLCARANFKELARRIRRQGGVLDADAAATLIIPAEPRHCARPRRATDDAPLRVVMCGHSLAMEGAPISQYELTIGLVGRRRIDPVVMAPADGPLAAWYRAKGISVIVHRSPLLDAVDISSYNRGVNSFAASIASLRPDLVYANTLQTFYAVDAASRLELPAVYNPRETGRWQTYFDDHPPDVQQRALACFRLAERVVFVARASLDAWMPVLDPKRAEVIPNGLDMRRLDDFGAFDRARMRAALGAVDDTVVVLAVGTLCARKGQKDLVDVLLRRNPGAAPPLLGVLIGACGDGYGRAVADAVSSSQADQRIRLLSPTDSVVGLYRAADVFVCSSRSESYPRTVLEAMTHGLAIVTTPVDGVVEQVEENVSALFYPPADLDALAGRLEWLAGDPNRRHALGEAARRRAAGMMNYERMVDGYARVFTAAVRGAGESGI